MTTILISLNFLVFRCITVDVEEAFIPCSIALLRVHLKTMWIHTDTPVLVRIPTNTFDLLLFIYCFYIFNIQTTEHAKYFPNHVLKMILNFKRHHLHEMIGIILGIFALIEICNVVISIIHNIIHSKVCVSKQNILAK